VNPTSKPTMKEVYGKAVKAMANTKAPMTGGMFKGGGGMGKVGGPPTTKPSHLKKAAPPPRGQAAGKPKYCPTCNYRGSEEYCPQCGSRMEPARAAKGAGMPPAQTLTATRH